MNCRHDLLALMSVKKSTKINGKYTGIINKCAHGVFLNFMYLCSMHVYCVRVCSMWCAHVCSACVHVYVHLHVHACVPMVCFIHVSV